MSAISSSLVSGYGPVASVKSEAATAQDTAQIASQQKTSADAALAPIRYSNLRIFVDPLANQVVLEKRDPLTGDAVSQAPTQQQLRAYRLQRAVDDPGTVQSKNPVEQSSATDTSTKVSRQA